MCDAKKIDPPTLNSEFEIHGKASYVSTIKWIVTRCSPVLSAASFLMATYLVSLMMEAVSSSET
jgi:hypothetical protein